MKLVVAIVQDKDAAPIMNALAAIHQPVTRLASTGGFLREGNTTLLLGVEDEGRVEEVVRLIGELGQARERLVTPLAPMGGPVDTYVPYPVEVVVGGAIVFVLPVERFERL